jgi:hypothetical protein
MARKTAAPVAPRSTAPDHAEPGPALVFCLVTRLPGAPPRRAGRVWAEGETHATLTEAEIALVAADPRYRIERPAAPNPAA